MYSEESSLKNISNLEHFAEEAHTRQIDSDATAANPSTAETKTDNYRRSGYSPIPDESNNKTESGVPVSACIIIALLAFAIGLAVMAIFAERKISVLNRQLADQTVIIDSRDEQIGELKQKNKELEEKNKELQEKVDSAVPSEPEYSAPDYHEYYNYNFGDIDDYIKYFEQIFGGAENWSYGFNENKDNDVSEAHGYLGVRVSETEDGVVVNENLPTQKGDAFEKDDRILKVEDTEIKRVSDIAAALSDKKAGETVQVTVERNGETRILDIELTEKYTEPTMPNVPAGKEEKL